MDSLDPLYVHIGKQVRDRRTKKGITQERLAELTSLTRTSITNIEKGRQKLPMHTLYVLANALGAEATELLPNLKTTGVTLEKNILKDFSKKEIKWVEAVIKGGATYENK